MLPGIPELSPPQVLTLPSNERIDMSPSMRLIFETENLRHATPATVSRAGVLLLEASDMGWQSVTSSWVEQLGNKRAQSFFVVFFSTYAAPTLEYATEELTFPIALSHLSIIQNVRHLLDSMLNLCASSLHAGSDKIIFERLFVFSFVWGVGAMLENSSEGRKKFSTWWRKTFKEVDFPEAGSIFDYCVNTDATGFVTWESMVAQDMYVEVKDLPNPNPNPNRHVRGGEGPANTVGSNC